MKSYLIAIVSTIFFSFISCDVMAGSGGGKVARVRTDTDGTVLFGITSPSGQPPGTCTFYGDIVKFETTTPGGKNYLAMLVAAKVTGAQISIWYTDSDKPGTKETNGCNEDSIATLDTLSLD